MNVGATELLIILAVVLLLFGSTRLPRLFRSLGQASKEFKAGAAESPEDDDRGKEIGPKDEPSEETKRSTSPTQG